MKRKQNDNGLPPGHPNVPSPKMDLAGAVQDTAEDIQLAESERNKRLGLNCSTSKAPWFRGGNNENQS